MTARNIIKLSEQKKEHYPQKLLIDKNVFEKKLFIFFVSLCNDDTKKSNT